MIVHKEGYYQKAVNVGFTNKYNIPYNCRDPGGLKGNNIHSGLFSLRMYISLVNFDYLKSCYYHYIN